MCCAGCPRATRVKRKWSRGSMGRSSLYSAKHKKDFWTRAVPAGSPIKLQLSSYLLLHVRTYTFWTNFTSRRPKTTSPIMLLPIHFVKQFYVCLYICWVYLETVDSVPTTMSHGLLNRKFLNVQIFLFMVSPLLIHVRRKQFYF